jgi:ABC-type sugar transport system ATPase subunit
MAWRYADIMASILLDDVTIERAGVEVIRGMTLAVENREFFVLIGPSGSGKTTVLRVVAGLDLPVRGNVLFDGDVVTRVEPARRDVAMVFQDNTLLPFRSVRENVSFPLEIHHVERSEIERRVLAQSRAMAIDRFLDRMPDHLAAGHQQLVQAARALVRRPSIFLLDEPLARMDSANRRMMRTEIRLLQRGYGVTTLYATNDQEEAMVLADRIGVIDDGLLRQVGTPDEIYRRPADVFVAGFVGSPPMALLPGDLSGSEVHIAAGSLPVPRQTQRGPITVGVRPEDWEVVPTAGLPSVVTSIVNHGGHVFAEIDLGGDPIVMRFEDERPTAGDTFEIWPRRFHLFDPSGNAVAHID